MPEERFQQKPQSGGEASSREILDSMADAVLTLDESGRIQSVNQAGELFFGYECIELAGRSFSTVFQEPSQEEFTSYFKALRGAKQGASPLIREAVGLRKDGTHLVLELAVTQIPRRDKPIFVISARNKEYCKISEADAHYSLNYDLLTGLPNQKLFRERFRMSLANASRLKQNLSIACLNLDHFRNLTATLGHSARDQILQETAKRLSRCVREGDTISRFDADEFVVLLHVSRSEDSVRFAQRILKVLRASYFIGNKEYYITPSIGISLFPFDGSDEESLLTNAMVAMEEAKKVGGDTYRLYDTDIGMMALDRIVVENELHKGLERGELILHYQPIIDANTLKIQEVESLLRWNSKELGMIQPDDFIWVAEESGLIVKIGEWVLHTSCNQDKLWQSEGFSKLSVSVNVSPRQFQEEQFVSTVSRILEKTGLDPRFLELEVTENLMMADLQSAIEKLRELKELGIRLCLDDFGTGYSSFKYLKHLPIDKLKIDRSFVRDLGNDRGDATIAASIIDLSHRLNLEVVAEGVETKEQAAFLRLHGCDKLQGFLFSPPLAGDEFNYLLKSNHHTRFWEKVIDSGYPFQNS